MKEYAGPNTLLDLSKIIRKELKQTGGGGGGEGYSTEETRIGTWIDGKPLYRKVIPFTNLRMGPGVNSSIDFVSLDTIAPTSFAWYGYYTYEGSINYVGPGNVFVYPESDIIRLKNTFTSGEFDFTGNLIFEYTKNTD